jgi:hypothetical protein
MLRMMVVSSKLSPVFGSLLLIIAFNRSRLSVGCSRLARRRSLAMFSSFSMSSWNSWSCLEKNTLGRGGRLDLVKASARVAVMASTNSCWLS